MSYQFWGWEHADAPAITEEYPGIHNPRQLYDALSKLWCADTCAPRMRKDWTKENPTLGQCSITAFLAQDIFGGKVYGVLRPGGNYHCYNVIGDWRFDLTSEQFGGEALDYEKNPDTWVYRGDKPAIIDFYATWCGPCKAVAPILDDLAKEYKDQIYIYKIDTDQEQELAADFGIRSIPSLLFIPMNGQPQMIQGAIGKEEFKKIIDEFLLKE